MRYILNKRIMSKKYEKVSVELCIYNDYSVTFKPTRTRMDPDYWGVEIDPYSKTDIYQGQFEIMNLISCAIHDEVMSKKIPYIHFNNLNPKVLKTYLRLFKKYSKNIKNKIYIEGSTVYIYFSDFLKVGRF